MKSQARPWGSSAGEHGVMLYMWCPGCDDLHGIEIEESQKKWEFDGNYESPTISPSILSTGGADQHRCHSFVKAGSWQFLDDCTHKFAGQTIAMVDLPDWLTNEVTI